MQARIPCFLLFFLGEGGGVYSLICAEYKGKHAKFQKTFKLYNFEESVTEHDDHVSYY